MKGVLQGVVIGAVALLAGSRLWSRRRLGGQVPSPSRLPFGFVSLNSDTLLVARREVRERLRGKAFRVVTLVILAVVAAAILTPVLSRGRSKPVPVGLLGTVSRSEMAAIVAAGKSVGITVRLESEPDLRAARARLSAGQVALVVIGDSQLMVESARSSSDTSGVAQLVRAASAVLGVDAAFAGAGLSPGQATEIAGAKPLPVTSLEPSHGNGTTDRATSLIGVVLVFVMLSQYCTWTLIGVMEEKSSRVVEVLLATVRPLQLLGGKVLGIGVLALAQATLILGFALVLGKAVGSSLLHGAAPSVLLAAYVWLVLGYGFYCWVYAAAGSLAERQDQVQTLALPLSLPMIVGYVLALAAAGSGSASPFLEVLAYLPPTAPFAMPVLVGLGVASWWQFSASALLSVACTVGIARLAAGIYRRAVLRTGRRVHLRDVIRAGS